MLLCCLTHFSIFLIFLLYPLEGLETQRVSVLDSYAVIMPFDIDILKYALVNGAKDSLP